MKGPSASMRPELPVRARRAASAALVLTAALVGALAPGAAAAAEAPAVLPLPLPGAESLVTEGLTIEGPLINNISLPTLR
ncbi:hypothetical protein [Streptomyces glaucus]